MEALGQSQDMVEKITSLAWLCVYLSSFILESKWSRLVSSYKYDINNVYLKLLKTEQYQNQTDI